MIEKFKELTKYWQFLYCLVFLMGVISDFIWAKYIQTVAENKAISASIYSGLIMVLGISSVFAYTHDVWSSIPLILGGMTGTFITIKFKNRIKL